MAESIKDEISEYYSNTSSAVDEILAKLKEANSQHDEELQSRIDDVVKNIEEKNEEFKVAVESLEKDSEFEKFTIAFLVLQMQEKVQLLNRYEFFLMRILVGNQWNITAMNVLQ